MKRKNPYEALRDECRQWAFNVLNLTHKTMFFFDRQALTKAWALDDIRERTAAADTLGWDVVLKATDGGSLTIQYRKRHNDPPYSIRP